MNERARERECVHVPFYLAENMHKEEDCKHYFSIKVRFEAATKKGGGLTTIVEGESLRNRIG